jgi:hypothetical protein
VKLAIEAGFVETRLRKAGDHEEAAESRRPLRNYSHVRVEPQIRQCCETSSKPHGKNSGDDYRCRRNR